MTKPDDKLVEVTQADRELYKYILDAPFATCSRIDNMPDDTPELQQIAAHRQSQRASMEGEIAEYREALSIIVMNAALIPDPATGESTDCYAVPIDDIEEAMRALNRKPPEPQGERNERQTRIAGRAMRASRGKATNSLSRPARLR